MYKYPGMDKNVNIYKHNYWYGANTTHNIIINNLALVSYIWHIVGGGIAPI